MYISRFVRAITGASALMLMLPHLNLFNNENKSSNLLINLSYSAVASDFEGYVPPLDRQPIQRTDSAGSRGCPHGLRGSLIVLAPNDHVGLTVLSHPSFSWYASTSVNSVMQFSLVEPGLAKPLFTKNLHVNQPGIIRLDLPQSIPELSLNREYRWTVSLVCNPKHPSENIYVRSWIKKIPITDAKLRDASNSFLHQSELRDRAQLFAQSGIWYDAIAEISQAYSRNPQDPLNVKYFHLLLDQVGLSQLSSTGLSVSVQ